MTRHDKLITHEQVSALADGQLGGDELGDVLAELAESDEALAAWHCYHVVGDVLRAGDLGDTRGDMAFVSRLRSRLVAPGGLQLNDESVVLDDFRTGLAAPNAGVVAPRVLSTESANDSSRRWKLVAGLASMIAVVAVGWHLSSVDAGLGTAAELAAAPAANTAAVASIAQPAASGLIEPTVMLRDARLDELLAAHKQFGGTSALQMPAGFLRNATFETASR